MAKKTADATEALVSEAAERKGDMPIRRIVARTSSGKYREIGAVWKAKPYPDGTPDEGFSIKFDKEELKLVLDDQGWNGYGKEVANSPRGIR